jgi:adenylate cyclase
MSGEPAPGKILIVDDNPMNNDLLEGILSPWGFRVDTAGSGREALIKSAEGLPDLILLDVMMPEMDGYEVCRRIRGNSSLPYISIIFITASELEQRDIVKGLNAGGDDYIRKPFDEEELLSRIKACLRIKSLYDQMSKIKVELASYVSKSTIRMVERMASGKTTAANRSAEVTVLFSDMRGFAQLSQDMDPEAVFQMLNRNLGIQIDLVEKYNGVIDKLNGDEVMVVFEGPDKERKALQCARAIVLALSKLRVKPGDRWMNVGIGINTGPVFWGALGTVDFKDFTVIGNTVNIAARLCGLADRFQVLFTDATLKAVGPERFPLTSIGKKNLKGMNAPVEVYALTV